MRYLTFSIEHDTTRRLGLLQDGAVLELPGTLLDLIHGGPAAWTRPRSPVARHDPATIRWHAPIPRPAKNVFCVGRNYVSHIEEQARARGQQVDIPTIPVYFTKAPTTVNGPFDDVTYRPSTTRMVDWEAELGVIIGVTGRDIARTDAMRHVFGYTAINDVTARDLQKNHFQFFKGKSLDGFCPMGPVVVTADEFGDPQQKDVITRVNGVEKQHSSTSKMIFPVNVLIESLSQGLTLEAGDIIATGTPDGVGFGRVPQEFLLDGHILETDVEGIGTMRNRIVCS
ncbi:MAG: fumarylacetoacetate hydrolase family protein [Acidimicrobiia bacterium]|nr:fumarylacetoacetate hydrolase family protein [Acidimicrobiia bacterium]